MSRFALQAETITVRGEQLTIRELSSKQKGDWAKRVGDDQYSAPYVLVSLVTDPPVSVEEAEGWPSQIVEQIVEIAKRLSGMQSASDEDSDAKNA